MTIRQPSVHNKDEMSWNVQGDEESEIQSQILSEMSQRLQTETIKSIVYAQAINCQFSREWSKEEAAVSTTYPKAGCDYKLVARDAKHASSRSYYTYDNQFVLYSKQWRWR